MVQGTGSGAGKSLIAAALCRVFSDRGLSVAPFKSQNMALNSFITCEGGEIGRAQALQAEAARLEPSIHMNPILLKASGEMGSQVIIQGRALRHMKAQEYYAYRQTAWEAVRDSYERLSRRHDIIVIEGAGSPAEINLMDVDIVNMAVAKHAKAPVLLVGDIDKGGVFASLYGTVKLLGRDGRFVRAFIINKFRGDMEILRPGLEMIRQRTGKPVIGVLPYITEIGLPEEDGLALGQRTGITRPSPDRHPVKVAVVRLRYISNFTDFDPLFHEEDVEISYTQSPMEIEHADWVIVPGTKNTVKDLAFLRERGLDGSLRRAFERGVQITGICGGYQMLGRTILDPHCVESPCREVEGLGLLNIVTTFEARKVTCQDTAEALGPVGGHETRDGDGLKGYEIHMGVSDGEIGLFRLHRKPGEAEVPDGSQNRNCWGTYLHGIFDNDSFRRGLINALREKKGTGPLPVTVRYGTLKEKAIDNLAGIVREHLDMAFITKEMGL